MTFVLAATSKKSIWLLTDRRLTYGDGRQVDDARKLLIVDQPDGSALIGYAGLGETELGTEPGDWMERALIGRSLTIPQSIGVLADAVNAKMPAHLWRLPKELRGPHRIVAPAFVNGEVKLYVIELIVSDPKGRASFHAHEVKADARRGKGLSPWMVTHRIVTSGLGGEHLLLEQNQGWQRTLIKVLDGFDSKRIAGMAVATHLARLNERVHDLTNSVSRECIVAWRTNPYGGGTATFTGSVPDNGSRVRIPWISNGGQLSALLELQHPFADKVFEAFIKGEKYQVDEAEEAAHKAAVAELPSEPDDKLR